MFGFLKFSFLQHGITQFLKARPDYPIKKTIRCRLLLKFGFQKAHTAPALGTVVSGMLPDIYVIQAGQNFHALHQWFTNDAKPPVSRITSFDEIQSAIAANHLGHQTPSLAFSEPASGHRKYQCTVLHLIFRPSLPFLQSHNPRRSSATSAVLLNQA